MKILFLDFDGVLNSAEWMTSQEFKETCLIDHGHHIDKVAVARLERIVQATGCKIVVSSTWRLAHSQFQLQNFLEKRGFTGEIIGITPNLRGVRGHEIAAWLNENGPVESFVILDDSDDMVHLMHKLVHTSWEHGLEDKHVEAAIEHLNG